MSYRKIATPVLISILVYAILGSVFLSMGTTIYHTFPAANFIFNQAGNINTTYYISLRNNAPFTFPFVNPAFLGSVKIVENTGQVDCLVSSSKGELPCEESTLIDLGYIPAGQEKNIALIIEPHDNNFTIQADAYLNYLTNIKVKSVSLKCVDQGYRLYSCK